MSQEINLALKTQAQKKAKDAIFMASLGFFLVCFIIGAGMLIYSLSLSAESSGLEEKRSNLRGKLAALADEKGKFLTLNERLVAIRRAMAGRKKIDTNVEKILTKIPQNLSVDSISADNKVITIRLESGNLSEFNTLIEEVLPALGRDRELGLKNVNVGSFAQEGGNYRLAVVFNFTNSKSK